jgi:hypothetical protein
MDSFTSKQRGIKTEREIVAQGCVRDSDFIQEWFILYQESIGIMVTPQHPQGGAT